MDRHHRGDRHDRCSRDPKTARSTRRLDCILARWRGVCDDHDDRRVAAAVVGTARAVVPSISLAVSDADLAVLCRERSGTAVQGPQRGRADRDRACRTCRSTQRRAAAAQSEVPDPARRDEHRRSALEQNGLREDRVPRGRVFACSGQRAVSAGRRPLDGDERARCRAGSARGRRSSGSRRRCCRQPRRCHRLYQLSCLPGMERPDWIATRRSRLHRGAVQASLPSAFHLVGIASKSSSGTLRSARSATL